MAEREYFLGPALGTKRSDVLQEVGAGWLKSLLDERMVTILEMAENLDPDLIVKIKVIDAP